MNKALYNRNFYWHFIFFICILTILSFLSCETGKSISLEKLECANYSKLTSYNNKNFSCRFFAKKKTSTNEYSSDDKLWETMINDIIDESVKSCQTEVLTGYKEKIHSTQINDKEKMIADFSNYISTKSWAKTTVLRRNESKNSNQLCIEIELEVRPINIQSFIPGTEESEWYRAKNSNSLDLVRKFQQRFPNGNYAIDALHLIDKLENYAMIIEEEKQWIEIKNSNVGQVNDVTSFIKKFPYGKHIDNARQLLKQLHENILCSTIEKSNSVELINHNIKEIDQYIHEYPEGECLKIAQDRKKDWFAIKDWKDVQKINKINIVNTQRVENIIAHIKKYPNRISYTDAISQLKMLLSNLNNKIETMTSIEDFIVKKNK